MQNERQFIELPPKVRELLEYPGGRVPFDIAASKPNIWIPVYDLRPLELPVAFLGIPRLISWVTVRIGRRANILNAEPFALMFDAVTGLFYAWPLALMPKRTGLPRNGPWLLWEFGCIPLWRECIVPAWLFLRMLRFGDEPVEERTERTPA